MIRWERGSVRGHDDNSSMPAQYAEHLTAWDGNKHIGSLVRVDAMHWSMHLRKRGGGWLDGPRTFGDAEQAKQAFVAWIEYGGAA